ncbi:hypothetical protein CHS0354_030223 [Potamilus streckersoni]|uniref:YEATS domain-containing protein 2 n=1 Tax=Potamilus streckersoni TaxID=2493646 RepID=A0AAE0VI67_9BIVA|nr:hypothetical protein CHS0354_030223 [Potamilus streckersoni]
MSRKRLHVEIDPDYEDVTDQQTKRQRVIEEDAKEATIKKITSILWRQFAMEIENKEEEIISINQRLDRARCIMDRLRACVVAKFYSNASQIKISQGNSSTCSAPSIHPAVKELIGKAPRHAAETQAGMKQENSTSQNLPDCNTDTILHTPNDTSQHENSVQKKSSNMVKVAEVNNSQTEKRAGRFKVKKRIVVGNISRYIPVDKRDENDQATHKWMVYVRGSKEEPRIDHYVKKVWFFLHPSYRPNDLVEVSQSPFHLTRRGWGEFPVRVQLHFHDSRNKRVDIIHQLKLDRTYTGLQSLGAETVVDVELEKEIVLENCKKTSRGQGKSSSKDKGHVTGDAGLEIIQPDHIKTELNMDMSCGEINSSLKSNEGRPHTDSSSINSGIVTRIKSEPVDLEYHDSFINSGSISHDTESNVNISSLHQILTHNIYCQGVTNSKVLTSRTKGGNSNEELTKGVNSSENLTANDSDVNVLSDNQHGSPRIALACGSLSGTSDLGGSVSSLTGSGSNLSFSGSGSTNSSRCSTPTFLPSGSIKIESPSLARSATPTTNLQVVLQGMGSLGASAMESTPTLPVPKTPVKPITVSQAKSPRMSRPSTPQSSNKSGQMGCPSPNTVILSGVGSLSGSPLAKSRSDTQLPNQNARSPQQKLASSQSTVSLVTGSPSASPTIVLQGIGSLSAGQSGGTSLKSGSANSTVAAANQVMGGSKVITNQSNVSGTMLISGGTISSLTSALKLTSGIASVVTSSAPISTTAHVLSTVVTSASSGVTSGQPNLVFVKCVDNQGKTYLIPQQIYTSLPQNTLYNQKSIQQKQVVPSVVTVTSPCGPKETSQSAPKIVIPVSTSILPNSNTKQVTQNLQENIVQSGAVAAKPVGSQTLTGPIILVQTEVSMSSSNTSSTVSQSSKQMALTKSQKNITQPAKLPLTVISPTQNMLNITSNKQVTDQKVLVCPQGSVGQLKVTSQGLLNVKNINTTNIKSDNMTQTNTNAVQFVGDIKNLNLLTKVVPANSVLQTSTQSFRPISSKPLVTSVASKPILASSKPVLVVPQGKHISLLPGKTQCIGQSLLSSNKVVNSPPQNSLLKSQVSGGNNAISVRPKLVLSTQGTGDGGKSQNMLVVKPKERESQSRFLIVPTTSVAVVSTATTVQTLASRTTGGQFSSGVSSTFSACSNSGDNSKTMFILLQDESGDKVSQVVVESPKNSQTVKNAFSRSGSVTATSSVLQVMGPAVGVKSPVTLVNDHKSILKTKMAKTYFEKEKRIIPPLKSKFKVRELETPQIIPAIRVDDFPDVLSLVRAAVKRHPVVSDSAGPPLHPYCAKCQEEWLSWNVGKRRASEWQRASSVRKFIRSYIGETDVFKGQQLWTTKQILVWCRIHAYSPHYLERPLHPTGIEVHHDNSIDDDHHKKFQSVSDSRSVMQEVTQIMDSYNSSTSNHNDGEVDIVSIELPSVKVKVKKEAPDDESDLPLDYLPVSNEARFVQETAQQIGVKFTQMELGEGIAGNLSEEVVYKSMLSFLDNIIREAFALKVNMGRYPDGIGVVDVYEALNNLPSADFLTNNSMGVPDDPIGSGTGHPR